MMPEAARKAAHAAGSWRSVLLRIGLDEAADDPAAAAAGRSIAREVGFPAVRVADAARRPVPTSVFSFFDDPPGRTPGGAGSAGCRGAGVVAVILLDRPAKWPKIRRSRRGVNPDRLDGVHLERPEPPEPDVASRHKRGRTVPAARRTSVPPASARDRAHLGPLDDPAEIDLPRIEDEPSGGISSQAGSSAAARRSPRRPGARCAAGGCSCWD